MGNLLPVVPVVNKELVPPRVPVMVVVVRVEAGIAGGGARATGEPRGRGDLVEQEAVGWERRPGGGGGGGFPLGRSGWR